MFVGYQNISCVLSIFTMNSTLCIFLKSSSSLLYVCNLRSNSLRVSFLRIIKVIIIVHHLIKVSGSNNYIHFLFNRLSLFYQYRTNYEKTYSKSSVESRLSIVRIHSSLFRIFSPVLLGILILYLSNCKLGCLYFAVCLIYPLRLCMHDFQ